MTTTNSKFNPKVYLDKSRIYRPVPGAMRVQRLYVWDEKHLEYRTPKGGGCYEARRYELASDGASIRKKKCFDSLEHARRWQMGADLVNASDSATKEYDKAKDGPLFQQVVSEWKKRRFSSIEASTQETYEKIISLYMGDLMGIPIRQFTAIAIDRWLDRLKDPEHPWIHSKKRKSFRNEVKLLSTILGYYDEYHDDHEFKFPIKRRHYEDAELNRQKKSSKDLLLEEFLVFRETLRATRYGHILAPLATVQYFQAQRISETAALRWQDTQLERKNPSNSRLMIRTIIVWPRVRTTPSYIKDGFKNADANEGIKEQPVFPETFDALMELSHLGAKGLVFQLNGKHLEYRFIQHWYDKAFRISGLPYSGTHIMRHGGCRNLYNQVPDLAVAQQLLGNSSIKTTTIYAKRHKGALTQVSNQKWAEHLEAGRNWSQTQKEKTDSKVISVS